MLCLRKCEMSFLILTIAFSITIAMNSEAKDVYVCCCNSNSNAEEPCLTINNETLSTQFHRRNMSVYFKSRQVICTDIQVNRKLEYTNIYNDGIVVRDKKVANLHKYYCIDGFESTDNHVLVNFCDAPHSYCQDKLCISQCQFTQFNTNRELCNNGYDLTGSNSFLQKEVEKTDFYEVSKLRNSLLGRQEFGVLFHNNGSEFSIVSRNWSILENGILHVHDDTRLYNYDEYCIDIEPIYGTPHFQRRLYIKQNWSYFRLDIILYAISFACILVSLASYLYYPSIRSSHGLNMTILFTLYSMLLLCEICLKFVTASSIGCHFLGHVSRYFSLAVNFWTTLIFCTTYWNTKSTLDLFPRPCNSAKNKNTYLNIVGVIILSSIYVEIGFVCNLLLPTSNPYRPSISIDTCTFESSLGKFYYWSSVKTILFVMNTSFLIITNKSCKNLVAKMRDTSIVIRFQSAAIEQVERCDNQMLANVWLFVTFQTTFMMELSATVLEIFIESARMPMPFELYSARVLIQTADYFHATEGIVLFLLFIGVPLLRK